MADALTAARELGCRARAGFLAITETLDLVVPGDAMTDRPIRRPKRRTPASEPPSDRGTAPDPEDAPASPVGARPQVEDDADAAREWVAEGDGFEQPTGRRAPDPEDAPASPVGASVGARLRVEEDADAAPEWVVEGDGFEMPTGRRVVIPPQPPIPCLQARAAMATVAATRRPRRRLDIRELVRRAARLRPFSPPPLLAELRTAPVVQLLIDRGEGMEPFAEDIRFLVRHLTDVAGRDRVERHTFVRTPLEGVDPNPFTDAAKAWRPAASGLVIAITDLGAGGPLESPDRGSAREWREVAETAARHGDVLRVLTPFARDRTPPGLTGTADVVAWDALHELVRLRG